MDRNKIKQQKRRITWVESYNKKLEQYKDIDPILLSYAAGLIDGEGCIHICKGNPRRMRVSSQYTLKISVGMSVKGGVELLHKLFGGTLNQKPNGRYKDIHDWNVSSVEAEGVLRLVTPYLVVKKQEALLGLEFRDHINSYIRRGGRIIEPKELEIREYYKKEMQRLKNG